MRKRYVDEEYESLKITEEEKKSVEAYSGFNYQLYNNLLEPGIENEMDYYETGTLLDFDANRIKRIIISPLYKNKKV